MNPMMQGRLRKIATAEQRKATGDDTLCCYHWFDYCSGRPLLDDELAGVRAPLRPGDTWLIEHVSEATSDLPPRPAASSPRSGWPTPRTSTPRSPRSPARPSSCWPSAPRPSSSSPAQQASLDEIRHARVCLTLAARYAASRRARSAARPRAPATAAWSPSPATPSSRAASARPSPPSPPSAPPATASSPSRHADALTTIADDETRHAELAWSTVAWAVRTGGRDVADALRALADELAARPIHHTPDRLPPETLAAHGRLSAQALAETRRDAWQDIIAPTLALLLA
jgi:hypothetical protein